MTRLSNLQYPMLLALYDNGVNRYMRIEEAQTFDQRPFRSMLIRKWCAFRPGHGFHITKAGLAALDEFMSTSIQRRDPGLPLTAYFDPTAYGLTMPPSKKAARLHVMPARAGAA